MSGTRAASIRSTSTLVDGSRGRLLRSVAVPASLRGKGHGQLLVKELLDLARSLGLDLPLARGTKKQYDRMVAVGLGELDKSGIAELTFRDRHKHSSDRA